MRDHRGGILPKSISELSSLDSRTCHLEKTKKLINHLLMANYAITAIILMANKPLINNNLVKFSKLRQLMVERNQGVPLTLLNRTQVIASQAPSLGCLSDHEKAIPTQASRKPQRHFGVTGALTRGTANGWPRRRWASHSTTAKQGAKSSSPVASHV